MLLAANVYSVENMSSTWARDGWGLWCEDVSGFPQTLWGLQRLGAIIENTTSDSPNEVDCVMWSPGGGHSNEGGETLLTAWDRSFL